MPKKTYLDPGQNARLRAIVRNELLSRVPTQLHLAPLLGMHQGNLSRFLDGKVGVGAAIALRIAFLLNRSLDDVLGINSAETLTDAEEHRYPSRILAARSAYLDGVSVEQIRSVLSSALRYDQDPGAQWWLKLMHMKRFAKRGNKQDTAWALKQLPHSSAKARAKPEVARRVRRRARTSEPD
jgi:plasmid maintenance system antidote protein VapI